MATRTGLSGYLQTFVTPVVLMGIVCRPSHLHRTNEREIAKFFIADYMPVFFQACKGASPIGSGVDMFGFAFSLAPMAMVGGITIAKSKQYRPQIWLSWSLVMIGMGLLSTLSAESSRARAIGFQTVAGTGLGIRNAATFFPVLAPLPVSSNAPALALFTFFRNFAQVGGPHISPVFSRSDLI